MAKVYYTPNIQSQDAGISFVCLAAITFAVANNFGV